MENNAGMVVSVIAVRPSSWYCGMLMYEFTCTGGINGKCHSVLYRYGMEQVDVTLEHAVLFKRGFALASKPNDWVPRVGDMIQIHASQL